MAEKTEIVNELGADELLLPRAISEGLVANDRAKYFFALVQSAKAHADNPTVETSSLRSERIATGVADESLDSVVISSTRLPDGRYQIPQIEKIFDEAVASIEEMIRPLKSGVAETRAAKYAARLESIKRMKGGAIKDGMVRVDLLDAMTSGSRENGDSLHLMVMNLHKELNALQSAIYQDSVDGASVYGITDSDRRLISSFMKGVNKTSKLKFEHPGLGTTATRSGDVLMIQNDIGQTDAHVIVIRVKGNEVMVTYTDVHRQRLLFFRSMFEKFGVAWNEPASKETKSLRESEEYYMSTGVYNAKDGDDLELFLSYLGSRLVFLIDWNKARKQLKLFLPKGDVIQTLSWGAENNYGHMAFLKMGGDKMVLGAIEQSANAPLRFGDQFYEVLGERKAREFLKFVLATCSEGLIKNKSEALIHDEVRAELAELFHSVDEDILGIASKHASLVVELAVAARDDLIRIQSDDREFLKRTAERGKKWESEADSLLNKVRLEVKRSNAPPVFEEVISHSDDAADSLEDALFLITLTGGDHVGGRLSETLLDLAEIAARASMEFMKAMEDAKSIHKWSPREEIGDFLEAVDKVLTLEHDADNALRQVKEILAANASDFKQMQTVGEISKDIEQSTDALMKAAITLKDYVLKEVVGA